MRYQCSLRDAIASNAARFGSEWPTSAVVYLPGGKVPEEGTLLRHPDWARTMKGVLDAATRAATAGREAAIRAAMDHFYNGPVAHRAVDLSSTRPCRDASGREHTGLFSREDWSDYGTRGTQLEAPVGADYRGLRVLKYTGRWPP